MKDLLIHRGYDVLSARSGTEALEKIQTEQIDICLLDALMPGIDGFEVCRRIKADKDHNNIPVILITSFSDLENRIRGIEAGSDDFISKPIDTAEVLARIKMLLRVKLLNDRLNDAREYAENIVETVREPLLVLDYELKIISANQSFYDTFKVNPKETIGNFIYDLGNRQWDIPNLRLLLEEILPRNTVFNGYEVEHDFQDIGRKTILLNARQIFRKNLGSHIILLAMEDITERRLAEKIRADIDRITRHDLKTPLNPIISIPELLLTTTNLTQEQTDWIQLIRTSGYRLLDIIDSSLSLYKMEQGTYLLTPVSYNLLPLITNIERESSTQLARKRIKLLRSINGAPADARDAFMVNGEVLLCYTMLANLIKNAIEASPSDEVITVSCDQDAEWNYIGIHNRGAVPEEIRSCFFDKYVTRGKKTGTGLGTYSASLAARTQKGDIAMETSEETGTMITVRLPKTFTADNFSNGCSVSDQFLAAENSFKLL
jgi:DNA-binding response OmpR family regulator